MCGFSRTSVVPEHHHVVHRVSGLRSVALAQPRERVTNGIDCGADGLRLCLHQIDVFRIAQGFPEEQLVDRRPTTNGNLSHQCRRVEQVTQCAGDDQVLLNLT